MDDPFRIPEITPRQRPQFETSPAQRGAQPAGGESFADVLSGAVSEVQRLQNEADNAVRDLVSGEVKDITEAMVAIERADVSFQTMMAIRNKIVAAYEEVLRMQV